MRANVLVAPARHARDALPAPGLPQLSDRGVGSAIEAAGPPPLPAGRARSAASRELARSGERALPEDSVSEAQREAEEREWQTLLVKAQAAEQEREEREWRALLVQTKSAEGDTSPGSCEAEEREWQARIARARRAPRAAPRSAPRLALAAPPVVYWP